MKNKPAYRKIDWEVPGFDFIGRDCRYVLTVNAPAYVRRDGARELIVFQATEYSACISCIAHEVHDAVGCPAPGLEDEQEEVGSDHICLELLEHWIKMGILIQTYSPH